MTIILPPHEIKKGETSIYILSPTDCVKDRLAGYIHWKARECLDQAVLVASVNAIDMDAVKQWCIKEDRDGELYFREFKALIKQ